MRLTDDESDQGTPRSWLGLKEAGKRAYERGYYEEALNLYRRALQPEYECAMTADRQVILSNVVACRLQMGGDAQAAAAVNDAKQCVQLNPSWAKGHVRLASAYSALGKSNDACNSLQTALRLDPGNQMARQMLVRELRRERVGGGPSSTSTPPSVDDTAAPPPHNPDYVPPSSNNSNRTNRDGASSSETNNTTNHGIDMDFDNGWTLQDRLRFYRGQVMNWYGSQSEGVKNCMKAGLVFLAIYMAFGGCFGLENVFSTSRGGSTTPNMQGNYGSGNAYEQFYRERSSNYDNPYRGSGSSHHRHHNRDYDRYHGGYDDYTGGRSSYNHGSSWGGGSLWGDASSSLPSIAIIAGLAYLCHLAGINPLHALVLAGGARRGRRFGMPFGGGGGGFHYGGRRGGFRRRRPGAFYW